MSSTSRAVRSALVILAGAVGVAAPAAAQRRNPVVARAASAPEPKQPLVPYPGATVTVDPSWYRYQMLQQQQQQHHRQSSGGGGRRQPTTVYYVPVPVAVGAAYGGGYGGGVTDVNGRPLYLGEQESSSSEGYGMGTPNLTGAPYVVREGGAMVVDFGNGDRRTVPSCAALDAQRSPDGQPRTIFYQPAADGLVLHAGSSGRVAGDPPAGAAACYAADQYGRVVLDW